MTKDAAAIRDQLGSDPDVVPIITTKYDETIGPEEGPATAGERDIRNTFVLGDATLGVLGTATGDNGKQVVLGNDDRDIEIIRVVNPNNTFNEHFSDTLFQDSDQPNTADWDTTLLRLKMSSSSDTTAVYNTIMTTKTIFLNQETLTRATLNAKETKWSENDIIKYFLSADGGSNWEEVTLGVENIFATQGQNLKARIIFFGNGASFTYIEDLKISYIAS